MPTRQLTRVIAFTAISLIILGGAHAHALVCEAEDPTQINVIPQTADIIYDTSKTLAELQTQEIGTINPYGFDQTSRVNGYYTTGLEMQPSVTLDYKTDAFGRYACVWYKEVDITIKLDPTITIGKELLENKCRYNAVKEHENKHANVDRKLVNAFSHAVGQKVYNGLKQRGFIVGPISVSDIETVSERMQKTVSQITSLEFKRLELDRSEAQQAVDSLEEYERVSNLCKSSSSLSASRTK